MVVNAASEGAERRAADIAAILSERGLGGNDVDLGHRLDLFRRDNSRRGEDARRMAKRWAENAARDAASTRKAASLARAEDELSAGAILSLAYPNRIARNRGGNGAFLLANGRGANVDPAFALAREPFLAVAEMAGSAAQSRILLAAPITLDEIEQRFSDRIERRKDISFDAASASLRGRYSERLGAIPLIERPLRIETTADTADILAQGIAQLGIDKLPWTKALRQWRDRVMFLRQAEGGEWPDLSESALAESVKDWLSPMLLSKTALADISSDELETAVGALLPWNLKRRLDVEAPTHFSAPSGSSVPIDYGGEEGPRLAIRVQELYGLDRHPSIAGGKVPLLVELLSPAQRPVQVTRDLPGFWRGSYAAVKSEMRGRYPRHSWPDDPLHAAATRRAKPRGQ
jgi:ATP-dependent helicase HrpB